MLTELFVLPPSITSINIEECKFLEFTWEEDAESKSVHVEQLDTTTSLETSVPKQSAAWRNHPLPCLEYLRINTCNSLVILPNLPPTLKLLYIKQCQELCSASGHLDALKDLYIRDCNKLQSLDSLGYIPSLESLRLLRCKRLTSLPGAIGSYSALKRKTIKYCPSIDLKPLYKRRQQFLDSLEVRDLVHAQSSDPLEGPKLKDSWMPAGVLKSQIDMHTLQKERMHYAFLHGDEDGLCGTGEGRQHWWGIIGDAEHLST